MRKYPPYYLVPVEFIEDERVVLLIDQLGLEALGALHFIYAYLTKQPDRTSAINIVKILAKRMNTSEAKVEAVILKYGLFVVSTEGRFFSPDLNEWLLPFLLKSEKMRTAAIARWQKESPLEIPESTSDLDNNNAHAMHMHNTCNTNKRNKRKEINETIIKEINVSFIDFWNLYDKKRGDKVKLEKKWSSLTDQEREAAMGYIPSYKASQPDKLFRKDPATFLNNRSWEDEIISSQKSGLRPAHEIYNELYGSKKSYKDLLTNLEEGQ